MKLDEEIESPIRPVAGSMTLIQFVGKVCLFLIIYSSFSRCITWHAIAWTTYVIE